MTLQGCASSCYRALVSAVVAVLIGATPAASAEKVDPFTVSGVQVAASAESTATARDLAMIKGRSLAWSELFQRLTAQDQWEKQPKLTDKELSRLIPLFEVRNERRNTRRYLAEATFHFNQAEVWKLLRAPNVGLTDRPGSSRLIPLAASKTGFLDRFTEIGELRTLSSINYGFRKFLTADVRFDSLENWAKIRAQSALVEEVGDLDVIGLSLHEAEIDLTYFGPIEELPKAMARQNLELSNSAGHYTLELGTTSAVASEPAETQRLSP